MKKKRTILFVITFILILPILSITIYAASNIKLNKSAVTLHTNETVSLKLLNNRRKIKWSSSNKEVASVSKNGKVKAKKSGTAMVTAKTNNKKYRCKITVKNKISNIKVKIGLHTFEAALEENKTAQTFAKLLPKSVSMQELNGNEKYCYLNTNIKKDADKNYNTIYAGDIMCFGDNCIVIFYKTFTTTYQYVKIGHINDTAELENALGEGSIEAVFTK